MKLLKKITNAVKIIFYGISIYLIAFFHVDFANNTSIGNTSSLPISISKINTIFDNGEKDANVVNPPNNGPTLLTQLTTDVKDVVRSKLSLLTTRKDVTITPNIIVVYVVTPCTVSSDTVVPSTFKVVTVPGESVLFNPLMKFLKIIIILEIFSPPAVEPTHPPMNININNRCCDSFGQALISTVANPVVDIIDDTQNSEFLADSPIELYNG